MSATDPSIEADPDDERATAIERRVWQSGRLELAEIDHVAREEPLEIRIAGTAIAVVMRTPGHDEDLVRGFLISERIVTSPDQIAGLRHCTTFDSPEAEDNVMLVQLDSGVELDLARLRRNLYVSSSCGVCGKASIAAAMALPPLEPSATAGRFEVDPELLLALPGRLRESQEVFSRTGGLHATGLFSVHGERLVVREDVGRHNALDKVIGAAAELGLELDQALLVVSGRVSFEVVQKALAVGAPMIVALSAPTSLAVELARRAGLTLVAFVRERRFCIYSGEARLAQSP